MNPIVIDAGPALSFLAAGHQDLLCAAMDLRRRRLLMPETVQNEVNGRAQGRRGEPFRQAPSRLQGLLAAGRVEILPDDIEDMALVHHLERIAGIPMVERLGRSDDLGEEMVIAHALKLTAAGKDVVVLIDDYAGRQKAKRQQLRCITTINVLKMCATGDLVPTRGEMREIYERIAAYDDGHAGWDKDPTRNPLADKTLYLQHRRKPLEP